MAPILRLTVMDFAPVMYNHWDLERYQACEDLSLQFNEKDFS